MKNSEFHSYISDDNEQYACDLHAHKFHLFFFKESGILMSGMSTVWEDTNGFAKKYRHALDIYLMTVLSYPYGIIMDFLINVTVHGNNVVDVLNGTDKHYLKGKIEPIVKSEINDNTYIGMLPSASKDVSIKFAYQCLYIINNKEILNGIKSRTKIQKRQSQLKYQSSIYNVKSNSDVNHRGMKMIWNNNIFTSLNVINGKKSPYGSKGILRHYHYQSDP